MKAEEPIRILHFVPSMRAAGIENFIMNLYRQIDRSKIQFDFVVHTKEPQVYDSEIEQLGGKIYRLTYKDDKNFFKYIKDLNQLFSQHPEYRIVHGNMQSMMPVYLHIAKKHKIPVRIAHAHNSDYEKSVKGFVLHLLSKFTKYESTTNFACSNEAAEYLFSDQKYHFIPNAIDANKFKFNANSRAKIRKQLNLSDDDILIGHIGRFEKQKNHNRLIEIFRIVHASNPKFKLMLIGSGKLQNQIKRRVEKANLSNSVIFIGEIEKVSDYYNAMDIFILPSLYEGLPVTLIEAQFANLNCVVSDNITKQAKLTDQTLYIDLRENNKKWAKYLNEIACNTQRTLNTSSLENKTFDIKNTAPKIQAKYEKLAIEQPSKPTLQSFLKLVDKYSPLFFTCGYIFEIAAEMCFTVPILQNYLKLLNLIGIALILSYDIIKLSRDQETKKKIAFSFLLIVSLITYLQSTSTIPLRLCLLIFAVHFFSFKKYIKLDFKIRLSICILVFTLMLGGIIDNYLQYRPDGTIRQTLGFAHPNTIGFYLTTLAMELLYLDYSTKRHTLRSIAFALSVLLINFFITNSRTPVILLIGVVVAYFIPQHLYNKIYQNKLIKFLIQYSFLLFTAISFSLAILYKLNPIIGEKIDIIFSHRPMYYDAFINHYPYTIFGTNVPDKFYIYTLDNSYILTILRFGIINYVIYLVLSIMSYHTMFNKKEYFLATIFMLTLFYGIMESTAIRPTMNVFAVQLYQALSFKKISSNK